MSERPGRRAPAVALAVLAGAGVVAVWWVFVRTRTGQLLDQAALEGSELGANRLWLIAEPVLDVISLPFIALVLLATMLLAVVRGRVLLAVQVAILMGGANLSTQVLKHLVLDRPDLDVGDRLSNALPSGHTTAAASVSAALVFVVPRRFRPLVVVLGVGYTSATGISTLVGQWHRPSDVVAAVLVVVAWAGIAAALGASWRGPLPERTAAAGRLSSGTVLGLLGVGGTLAAVGAALALQRSVRLLADGQDLASRADLLTAYAGGALGVLSSVCLGFALVLVVVTASQARVVGPARPPRA